VERDLAGLAGVDESTSIFVGGPYQNEKWPEATLAGPCFVCGDAVSSSRLGLGVLAAPGVKIMCIPCYYKAQVKSATQKSNPLRR
jgi:hypothetical protein